MRSLAFSRTNHLYMLAHSGNVRVYSASGDHNQAAMTVISLRGDVRRIIPAPNDSQIVIQTSSDDIEVWSLRRFTDTHADSVGISFDSSRLAAKTMYHVLIWDLPSGALLHEAWCYSTFQWSRIDLCIWLDRCICLNTETLQEETLKEPDDCFREPNHLYHTGNELRIRSSSQRDDPLFFTLPSRHTIKNFSSCGDRACILSREGQLLLFDVSCLDAYMKKHCRLESKGKISCTQCRNNLNHPIP